MAVLADSLGTDASEEDGDDMFPAPVRLKRFARETMRVEGRLCGLRSRASSATSLDPRVPRSHHSVSSRHVVHSLAERQSVYMRRQGDEGRVTQASDAHTRVAASAAAAAAACVSDPVTSVLCVSCRCVHSRRATEATEALTQSGVPPSSAGDHGALPKQGVCHG